METKWISVEEKLPEKKKKVLGYSPSTIGTIIAIYWGENIEGPTKGWTNMGVTHWMELPEEPK